MSTLFDDRTLHQVLDALGFVEQLHAETGQRFWVPRQEHGPSTPDPVEVLRSIAATAYREGRIAGLQEAQGLIAPVGGGLDIRRLIDERVEKVLNRHL